MNNVLIPVQQLIDKLQQQSNSALISKLEELITGRQIRPFSNNRFMYTNDLQTLINEVKNNALDLNTNNI